MQIVTKQLGVTPYQSVFHAMRQFTDSRCAETPDELWLTQHYPVFTQGQAGKAAHLLRPSDIPLVQSDRGGQITYHAPGQIVAYTMIDIKRRGIGVRQMVSLMENSVIAVLADLSIDATANPKAPGVYVAGEKIASLGLRVRRGRTYHGLALNAAMDLTPFQWINPCGYAGLAVTQVSDLQPSVNLAKLEHALSRQLIDAINTQTLTV